MNLERDFLRTKYKYKSLFWFWFSISITFMLLSLFEAVTLSNVIVCIICGIVWIYLYTTELKYEDEYLIDMYINNIVQELFEKLTREKWSREQVQEFCEKLRDVK